MTALETARGRFALARRSGATVITSPSLLHFVGEGEGAVFLVRDNSTREVDLLAEAMESVTADPVVALGAGRVLDVAKTWSARTGVALTAFPSVLSGNAFATDRSVHFDRGAPVTMKSRRPETIVLDADILDAVHPAVHVAGLADVLATYTATYDWCAYPHSSELDLPPDVADISTTLVADCLATMSDVSCVGSWPAYGAIGELLWRSADLVVCVGSGRAVSGSEHRIATSLRASLPIHAWHGDVVALGVLIASELQGRWNESIATALYRSGFLARLAAAGLDERSAAEATKDARHTRPDRPTVLDDASRSTDARIEEAVAKVLDGPRSRGRAS